MPELVALTIRVSPELAARLETLASATKRSKAFLGAEALEEYVALHEWQIKAIEEGIKDIEEGRTVPHEAVREWLLGWGTENEKDAPTCK